MSKAALKQRGKAATPIAKSAAAEGEAVAFAPQPAAATVNGGGGSALEEWFPPLLSLLPTTFPKGALASQTISYP